MSVLAHLMKTPRLRPSPPPPLVFFPPALSCGWGRNRTREREQEMTWQSEQEKGGVQSFFQGEDRGGGGKHADEKGVIVGRRDDFPGGGGYQGPPPNARDAICNAHAVRSYRCPGGSQGG